MAELWGRVMNIAWRCAAVRFEREHSSSLICTNQGTLTPCESALQLTCLISADQCSLLPYPAGQFILPGPGKGMAELWGQNDEYRLAVCSSSFLKENTHLR